MWPFSRNDKRQDTTLTPVVENTIAAGSNVRGDLRGASFRVDGNVDGAVEADGAVVIGEGGSVHGSVMARDVLVYGAVRGDVNAVHLEIGPNGKIAGDVTVESFRMHKGGAFLGMSRMPGAEELAQVAIAALPPASDSSRGSKVPPATESTRFEAAAPRGRTLPPPKGAVLPPPAPGNPIPPPIPASSPATTSPEAGLLSQERLSPALEKSSHAPGAAKATSASDAPAAAVKSDPPAEPAPAKRAAAGR